MGGENEIEGEGGKGGGVRASERSGRGVGGWKEKWGGGGGSVGRGGGVGMEERPSAARDKPDTRASPSGYS